MCEIIEADTIVQHGSLCLVYPNTHTQMMYRRVENDSNVPVLLGFYISNTFYRIADALVNFA